MVARFACNSKAPIRAYIQPPPPSLSLSSSSPPSSHTRATHACPARPSRASPHHHVGGDVRLLGQRCVEVLQDVCDDDRRHVLKPAGRSWGLGEGGWGDWPALALALAMAVALLVLAATSAPYVPLIRSTRRPRLVQSAELDEAKLAPWSGWWWWCKRDVGNALLAPRARWQLRRVGFGAVVGGRGRGANRSEAAAKSFFKYLPPRQAACPQLKAAELDA